MSILGDIARVDPQELEALRSGDTPAYSALANSEHIASLDLDRAWDILRFLLDAVKIPANPISGGYLYPDEESAWGYNGNSRVLPVEQVRQAAHFLRSTPFETVREHFASASEARLYAGHWLDSPAAGQRIEGYYAALADFCTQAADAGQCTIFWAA